MGTLRNAGHTPYRSHEVGLDDLPLLVFPARGRPHGNDWMASARACATRHLPRLGSALFRGFPICGETELSAFASSFGSVVATHRGAAVRAPEAGEQLFVHCDQRADAQAQSYVVDHRELFRALAPAVRVRLVERGLRYVHTFGGKPAESWQEAFHSNDRHVVEAWCKARGATCEWQGGGRLRIHTSGPSFVRNPRTNELLWTDLAPLLAYVSRSATQHVAPAAEPMAVCVQHLDGAPLEHSLARELSATLELVGKRLTWEPQDVLVLDGLLASHVALDGCAQRELVFAAALPRVEPRSFPDADVRTQQSRSPARRLGLSSVGNRA